MSSYQDASRSIVGFQQQGTVDWTPVASGTVNFSVDILARLSKAGVEAFTLIAAQAIFSHARLGRQGEIRLNKALDNLSVFHSFGNVIWFGFGVKHIVRSMQESAEGMACIAVSASLTENYSTSMAGQILRELFLLYDPPADYTPALRQWNSLVATSEGLLASTKFGLILHGITKLCLLNDCSNPVGAGSPKDIAAVLKQIFEISAGRLDRLHLLGGADCAWIAAVAHWIFDLSVEIRDENGDILYRPDGARKEHLMDTQVTITYSEDEAQGLIQVTQKQYIIPSGGILFARESEHGGMSYGRVSWETCLIDVFGNPMRTLLRSQARTVGNCLGSAARIFLGTMRDEGYMMDDTYLSEDRGMLPPVSSCSYGKGFCLRALQLLPELNQITTLRQPMEAAVNQRYDDAAERYSHSMAQLKQLCPCRRCSVDSNEVGREGYAYCMLVIIQTISTLVRAMSVIHMHEGLEVRPSRRGIEMLYEIQMQSVGSKLYNTDVYADFRGLVKSWPDISILHLSHIIFTGRENSSANWTKRSSSDANIAAIAHYGLCFSLDTLTQITADPEQACRVTIIPGRIEWNGFVFDSIRDSVMDTGLEGMREKPYWSPSNTDIAVYDNLVDSSSPNIQAELTVVEAATETRGLRASYRASTPEFPGSYFSVSPGRVWRQLSRASTASSCHGNICRSLNGFRSHLVQGEGLLPRPSDWVEQTLPVIRVLSSQDLAVWVAIAQTSVGLVQLKYRLQMEQCVRCCVIGSEHCREDYEGDNPPLRVCLITSP